jgi:NAD(P)-dependent dehydrogenase (short-subunit alcohol dehydrogenase family)
MKLQNKIAVITGGNSGIDLATGQEFMAQGARVIIIARKRACQSLGECCSRPPYRPRKCSHPASRNEPRSLT